MPSGSSPTTTTAAAAGASGVFGYAAPANGGFFATPGFSATVLFSFVAGALLSFAFSSRLFGGRRLPSTSSSASSASPAGALASSSSSTSVTRQVMSAAKAIGSKIGLTEGYKMTLVVRKDLKMGQGKIAAQCAHAAVNVIDEIFDEQEKARRKGVFASASASSGFFGSSASTFGAKKSEPSSSSSSAECKNEQEEQGRGGGESATNAEKKPIVEQWVEWMQEWRASGSAKVVLQVETEKDLMNIVAAANKAQIPNTYIRDAGRTQIAAGSKTVAAVGPAPIAKVDEITGHLKLL